MKRPRIFVGKMSSVATGVVTVISTMSRGGRAISAVTLLALMVLVTFDVSGRFFFALPIKGTYELSEFMLVVVVALSIAYTQAVKEHVRAEIVISRLSLPKQRALDALYSLLGMVFFILILKEGFVQAMYDLRTDLVSAILRIPAFPFKLLIPLGSFLMALELLVNLCRNIQQLLRGS